MGRCGEKMGGSGENMGGGESQEPVLHYSAELGGWDKAVGGGEVGGGDVPFWPELGFEPNGLCWFGVNNKRWLYFNGKDIGLCGEDIGGLAKT
jgi:hypothetical protein